MTLSVFADYFWKSILSAEAVAKIARYVPEQFTNFDIDQNGFVYTCTAVTQTSTNQIKKLSPLGVNIHSKWLIESLPTIRIVLVIWRSL